MPERPLILIADDDEDVQHLLTLYVRPLDCDVLTARGDVKDRLTGLQLGADDYLVKPFNRDEVVKRIAALLQRKHRDAHSAGEPAKASESMLFDKASGLPTMPMVLGRLKEMLIEQGEIGIVYVDIEQFESIEAEYVWAFFDEFLSCAGQA